MNDIAERLRREVEEWRAHLVAMRNYEDALRFADEDTLEVVVQGRKVVGASWEVTAVEYLLGLGGPDVWATVDGEGFMTIQGRWGSDHYTDGGVCGEGLLELTRQLMEQED